MFRVKIKSEYFSFPLFLIETSFHENNPILQYFQKMILINSDSFHKTKTIELPSERDPHFFANFIIPSIYNSHSSIDNFKSYNDILNNESHQSFIRQEFECYQISRKPNVHQNNRELKMNSNNNKTVNNHHQNQFDFIWETKQERHISLIVQEAKTASAEGFLGIKTRPQYLINMDELDILKIILKERYGFKVTQKSSKHFLPDALYIEC
eukprot:gb/GECH01014051.1/.p1 GENE.gb/GECH01014051.1/~~gb/GECH01014051.1/.p1  ORF type:complete len:210 (+),score=47.72 gb/GECH01014051.1/:1-630(+)